jgi:hypothetical protein
MALKFRPECEQVRLLYCEGEHLNRASAVTDNPGKVFAIVGPFDGHLDKMDLQRMLEAVCRGFNVVAE